MSTELSDHNIRIQIREEVCLQSTLEDWQWRRRCCNVLGNLFQICHTEIWKITAYWVTFLKSCVRTPLGIAIVGFFTHRQQHHLWFVCRLVHEPGCCYVCSSSRSWMRCLCRSMRPYQSPVSMNCPVPYLAGLKNTASLRWATSCWHMLLLLVED